MSLTIIHIYSKRLPRTTTPAKAQSAYPEFLLSFHKNPLFYRSMDLSASCGSIGGTLTRFNRVHLLNGQQKKESAFSNSHSLRREGHVHTLNVLVFSVSVFRGSPVERFSCKLHRRESRTPLTAISRILSVVYPQNSQMFLSKVCANHITNCSKT